METHSLAPDCLLTTVEGAVRANAAEFYALWGARPEPHTTMGVQVLRRQLTYGQAYTFPGDGNRNTIPLLDAPELIRECVRVAEIRAHELGYRDFVPNMAHTNWYPGGSAGLQRHQDSERDLRKGAPIFSFTFLSPTTPPRIFRIATDKKGPALLDMKPQNGDLIVMHGGAFQKTLWHEVPKTCAKAALDGKRINVTVRQSQYS